MHEGAIIRDNHLIAGAGGGIDLERSYADRGSVPSKLTMTGGLITRNSAVTSGGGVNVTQGATFLMTGGTISYNRAHHGGGVQVDANIDTSGFTMNTATGPSTIDHNYSETFGGGVALNAYVQEGEAYFNFEDGDISYNEAATAGGGIGFAHWDSEEAGVDYGNLIVNQSGGTLTHNYAPIGGGFFVSDLHESQFAQLLEEVSKHAINL